MGLYHWSKARDSREIISLDLQPLNASEVPVVVSGLISLILSAISMHFYRSRVWSEEPKNRTPSIIKLP